MAVDEGGTGDRGVNGQLRLGLRLFFTAAGWCVNIYINRERERECKRDRENLSHEIFARKQSLKNDCLLKVKLQKYEGF